MFQERIRQNYEALTPGFRRLADFILGNTLESAFLTATELARRVDVDPATVVRFSQELGYSGYRELSREVKSYVRDQITATSREAEQATDEASMIKALYRSSRQNLQHFMTTEHAKLAQVVAELRDAKRVWLIGEGFSFDLANFFGKLLANIGVVVTTFYPGIVEASQRLAQMKKGDVLLTFAIGNPSVDSGYVVSKAKEQQVKTICLASSDVLLPARESDFTVAIPTQGPQGIPSFIISGVVLGLLWEALASQDVEKTKAAFANTEAYMLAFLALRAQTEEYDVAAPPQI